MGEHMAKMESQLAPLNTMGSVIDEQMRVTFFMSSLSGLEEYAAALEFINSKANEVIIWNHVTTILLEKS